MFIYYVSKSFDEAKSGHFEYEEFDSIQGFHNFGNGAFRCFRKIVL